MSHISIIGSGFSGLSAACFSAAAGHRTEVFEKNATVGGRCRFYESNGFGFDMGPSWYWMPDVFERFFGAFGHHPSDFYKLVQLDPGFRIYYGKDDHIDVPAKREALIDQFEKHEPNSGKKLERFLTDAQHKYTTGMSELVYKPAYSWSEFMRWDLLRSMTGTSVVRSVRSHVRSYFRNPKLVALMEFPVLFLGAMPQQIPALYTLMNYAALDLGTWYPQGGMHSIIRGMAGLATSLGADIHCNAGVSKIVVEGKRATHLETSRGRIRTQGVISSADYHHTETALLDKTYANYPAEYWDRKTFAPSCLIFYLGVNKKVNGLIHHTLFFDADLDRHAADIYANPQWPTEPLFYVCCPSKTDPAVAPEGMENLFVLVPIAARLKDSPEMREQYFRMIMQRIENITGESIVPHIVHRRDYCLNDFASDYNAYGGNAYGLANTLSQTAVLKPKLRNRKVHNLFYAGQLTVPGPGIPPALISGEIASRELVHHLKTQTHEKIV